MPQAEAVYESVARLESTEKRKRGDEMSGVEIIVSVILLFVISIVTLVMFICMIAFPTKSSRVPPLPIKKQKEKIKW
jgi:ABC-type long-subunit fatty acid transport system fused permease/ATPase subunit